MESGYYSVLMSNNFPCTKLSNEYYIEVEKIEDNVENFVLFPNPVKSGRNVKFSGIEGKATIEIFDSLGRSVQIQFFKDVMSVTELNCDFLPPGNYTVRVLNNDQNILTNLVIF